MIKVHYQEKDRIFKSLTIKGHAKSAEKGKDLICAGVSSIVLGGLNALQNPFDFHIEVSEGNVSIQSLKTIGNHDSIVLKTILKQLLTIEESYPQFIKILK